MFRKTGLNVTAPVEVFLDPEPEDPEENTEEILDLEDETPTDPYGFLESETPTVPSRRRQ